MRSACLNRFVPVKTRDLVAKALADARTPCTSRGREGVNVKSNIESGPPDSGVHKTNEDGMMKIGN